MDKYQHATADYQNIDDFAKEHNGVETQFYTVDFWSQGSQNHSEGNFYKFVYELFAVANSFAPNTIKAFFNHPEEHLDTNEDGHSLYVLAKGQFNGVNYIVKATSLYKYALHHYILVKV